MARCKEPAVPARASPACQRQRGPRRPLLPSSSSCSTKDALIPTAEASMCTSKFFSRSAFFSSSFLFSTLKLRGNGGGVHHESGVCWCLLVCVSGVGGGSIVVQAILAQGHFACVGASWGGTANGFRRHLQDAVWETFLRSSTVGKVGGRSSAASQLCQFEKGFEGDEVEGCHQCARRYGPLARTDASCGPTVVGTDHCHREKERLAAAEEFSQQSKTGTSASKFWHRERGAWENCSCRRRVSAPAGSS